MGNRKRNEFLARIFDSVSSDYASIGPSYFRYFGKKLVEKAELHKGSNVLDVAMGRGASLFYAGNQVGINGSVIGIDFSEGMIRETRNIINESNISNINVYQMNAEELEFEENSFDNVICGLSIQFFPDHKAFLSEAYRVLKPGGRLIFSTWQWKLGKPGPMARVAPQYLSGLGPKDIGMPESRPNFGSEEVLGDLINEIGFKNILFDVENKVFYYHSFEEWWEEQMTHAGKIPFEIVKGMDKDKFMQFRKDLAKEFANEYGDGKIPYDATALFTIGLK